MQFFYLGVVLTVGLVFAAAVVGKLRSRRPGEELSTTIEAITALPPRVVRGIARLVLGGETAVVMLLALPPARPWGLALAAVLLAAFALAVGLSVHRGARTRCACFGSSGPVLRPRHAWRNAALAVAAGLALTLHLLHTGPASLPMTAVPLLVVCAGALAVIFIRLDDLLTLVGDAAPDS